MATIEHIARTGPHWIERTHKGIECSRRPDAEIPPHALALFRAALARIGGLLKEGERLTCPELCERITAHCPPHHNRGRVLAAIRATMTEPRPVHVPPQLALTADEQAALTTLKAQLSSAIAHIESKPAIDADQNANRCY